MILQRLRSASNRYEVLERYIEDQLLDLLEWPESRRPELSRGFAAIGFDSLRSVDLQIRMQTALRFVSHSANDFRQPTIAALAAHLLDSGLLPLDRPTSARANTDRG
ncbi:MAG: acyl carrier protein [Actinobacteria bacterium]|nr:acyl carrier protein [Actinomycetota bacterium]